MISQFGLRDFKGHRDTRVALGRFTVLVGDNASGKTSILDALSLQARLGSDVERRRFCRDAAVPSELLRRGSEGPIAFHSEGVSAGREWQTVLELRPETDGPDRMAWVPNVSGRVDGVRFDATASERDNGEWGRAARLLGTAGIFRLRPEEIAAAAYSDHPETKIDTDGKNTAVVLAAMKLGDDEAFQRVEDAMRRLIPTIVRIRIRRATVQRSPLEADTVIGSKLYFDFVGAPDVPAHNASHGTLIVLALLAILHEANRPNLILLDDFDHALHPRAQMELVRTIKQLLALDELKDVQVVATTHSPYVLDELEPSDVQAFALRDDGTVASRRLSAHPEAERTQGTLKAGQLWSLDPERDWVLRG